MPEPMETCPYCGSTNLTVKQLPFSVKTECLDCHFVVIEPKEQ